MLQNQPEEASMVLPIAGIQMRMQGKEQILIVGQLQEEQIITEVLHLPEVHNIVQLLLQMEITERHLVAHPEVLHLNIEVRQVLHQEVLNRNIEVSLNIGHLVRRHHQEVVVVIALVVLLPEVLQLLLEAVAHLQEEVDDKLDFINGKDFGSCHFFLFFFKKIRYFL